MDLALAACCLLGAFFVQGAAPIQVRLGYSREGHPIDGYSLGTGPASAVIVGGIHGRPELNSSDLVWQLLEYFESEPAAAPPGVRLVFVPEANPDGLADGTRELADGVDANRNFPTHDWRPATYAPGEWLPASSVCCLSRHGRLRPMVRRSGHPNGRSRAERSLRSRIRSQPCRGPGRAA